jgi:hypothetical protein
MPACFEEMKNLKYMRRKFKRSAIGWSAPGALRNRIWLMRLSKGRSLQVLAEEQRAADSFQEEVVSGPATGRGGSTVTFVDPRIEKLYILGNKARDGQVFCLVAQSGVTGE